MSERKLCIAKLGMNLSPPACVFLLLRRCLIFLPIMRDMDNVERIH